VTRVEAAGLTVRLDGGKEDELLPAAFVSGVRKDGAPNLSHAWARTVDGAQGGTWEACHLLGSSALDAYRGYTGQSRSRWPTHTWNTTRVAVIDHGGILADQRNPAEQVADALARRPDPSLAARSDPWVLDRQLRQLIAEHERVLSRRPPDRKDALAAAAEESHSARTRLADADAAAASSASSSTTGCRATGGWLFPLETATTRSPSGSNGSVTSKRHSSGSRRPKAGGKPTFSVWAIISIITGPRLSPPAWRWTTRSRTESTSSATPGPP
jgi:hypothetical protein